jgi:hypothetical protein
MAERRSSFGRPARRPKEEGMAIRYAERVKETTSNKPATAAAAFDLGGAPTGFRGFVAGIGNAVRCVYCAQKVDANGNPAGAWEIAVGTVVDAATDTLSREYLISSSSGSFIDWSAAGENSSPDVFVVDHASIAPAVGLSPVLADGARWFAPLLGTAGSSAFVSTSQTFFHCLDVPQPALIKALRINVTTAQAAQSARLMAYGDRAGLPYNLVLEGTVSLGATGVASFTPGSPAFFAGGRLWLALQQSGSTSQLTCSTGSPGVQAGLGTVYGPQNGSFAAATLGLRCTTQGYADGALNPWGEALTQNDNVTAQPIVQVQLEYL